MRRCPRSFVKAKLADRGRRRRSTCYFNPTEYSISKRNKWKYEQVKGNVVPEAASSAAASRARWSSACCSTSRCSQRRDARARTSPTTLLQDDGGAGGQGGGTPTAVPPFVTFQWGRDDPSRRACTSLTVAYKLFRPNGDADPRRRQAHAQAGRDRPARRPKGQATRRRARTAGLGVHTRQGRRHAALDRLRRLRRRHRWRLIAEANGVDNPLHLRRGTLALAPEAGELMPAQAAQSSEQHVAGVDVLVDGAPIDPEWRDADGRGARSSTA